MKLVKSKNCDVNYLAKIVKLDNFEKHPDPEVTKLKVAVVDGYRVIVGIDSKPGFYVYFPALSQINPDFLSYAGLFRDSSLNKDETKKGFFEKNGKVTAIKLRGQISEGFLIESEILNNWLVESINQGIEIDKEIEFDSVEHDGKEIWINKKYVKKEGQDSKGTGSNKQGKEPKGIDKIVPGQFRFHYDTVLIKKCPNVIHPEDLISITEKIHGTSAISAFVLCNYERSWQEKLAYILVNWIPKVKFTGDRKTFPDYDYIYASRTVVKNRYRGSEKEDGYYEGDALMRKMCHNYVAKHLSKGMTAYYEIVGFLPTGAAIQKLGKAYDYGCVSPEKGEEYTIGKHCKVRIYRLTFTNRDGIVHEFSAREVQQWCSTHELIPVKQWYYGYAKDLYPDLDVTQHWNENFMERLANDDRFYMEKNSPSCNNAVPHEGIVIRKENMIPEAWKLKCFAFLNGELKNDETNIEDNA